VSEGRKFKKNGGASNSEMMESDGKRFQIAIINTK
jgi:hypothetical protein